MLDMLYREKERERKKEIESEVMKKKDRTIYSNEHNNLKQNTIETFFTNQGRNRCFGLL